MLAIKLYFSDTIFIELSILHSYVVVGKYSVWCIWLVYCCFLTFFFAWMYFVLFCSFVENLITFTTDSIFFYFLAKTNKEVIILEINAFCFMILSFFLYFKKVWVSFLFNVVVEIGTLVSSVNEIVVQKLYIRIFDKKTTKRSLLKKTGVIAWCQWFRKHTSWFLKREKGNTLCLCTIYDLSAIFWWKFAPSRQLRFSKI